MRRILLWLWLLQSVLLGCATCAMMTPMTDISVVLSGTGERIEHAAYRWRFSQIYSSEIVVQFDYNRNGELDADELEEIKALKIDYLLPRQMLLTLTYATSSEQNASVIESRFEHFDLFFKAGHLIFTFDAPMDLRLCGSGVLTFFFEDPEGFFDPRVSDVALKGIDLNATVNPYLNMAAIQFSGTAVEMPSLLEERAEDVPKPSPGLLEGLVEVVKGMLQRVKEEHSLSAVLLLLFFAYAYGLIHALGPGHGKTLVGSYFLGNDRSYAKAALVALAIGVVHTFSACADACRVWHHQRAAVTVYGRRGAVHTYVSALTIIGIALWLMSDKIRRQQVRPSYRFSTQSKQSALPLQANAQALSHAPSCGCAACHIDHHSTDAALIISAGIVPCPGTVTLFIFALSMGLYSVGVLSALVMSLGMSTIIFASAAGSVLIRKRALSSNMKLKQLMEYVSLVIIFLLGVALLFM